MTKNLNGFVGATGGHFAEMGSQTIIVDGVTMESLDMRTQWYVQSGQGGFTIGFGPDGATKEEKNTVGQ